MKHTDEETDTNGCSLLDNKGNIMGFLEVLTLIFVALKLMNYIDWSWAQVFAPMWIAGITYILILVGFFVYKSRAKK